MTALSPRSRIFLAFVAGILVGLVPFSCTDKFVQGADKAPWMPPGSSHGTHYHGMTFIFGPPVYYYEYTISEDKFRSHFEGEGYALREIEGEERITRYLEAFISHHDYDFDRDGELEAYQRATQAFIRNGLFYSELIEDRAFRIAFDRDRSRAYVYRTTR